VYGVIARVRIQSEGWRHYGLNTCHKKDGFSRARLGQKKKRKIAGVRETLPEEKLCSGGPAGGEGRNASFPALWSWKNETRPSDEGQAHSKLADQEREKKKALSEASFPLASEKRGREKKKSRALKEPTKEKGQASGARQKRKEKGPADYTLTAEGGEKERALESIAGGRRKKEEKGCPAAPEGFLGAKKSSVGLAAQGVGRDTKTNRSPRIKSFSGIRQGEGRKKKRTRRRRSRRSRGHGQRTQGEERRGRCVASQRKKEGRGFADYQKREGGFQKIVIGTLPRSGGKKKDGFSIFNSLQEQRWKRPRAAHRRNGGQKNVGAGIRATERKKGKNGCLRLV